MTILFQRMAQYVPDTGELLADSPLLMTLPEPLTSSSRDRYLPTLAVSALH